VDTSFPQAESLRAESLRVESSERCCRPVLDRRSNVRDQVVEIGRLVETHQWRLVHLVADLDRSCEWALNELPVIDDAFSSGRLSYSKVRNITRVANADNAAELCELAEHTRAGHLTRAIAAWLGRHEDPDETDRRRQQSRSLRWWLDTDGMVVGSFRLPPSMAAVLIAMIETWVMRFRPERQPSTGSGGDAPMDASAPPSVTEWPSLDQQRADALIDLIGNGGGNVTTEVILHLRADGATLNDGTPITGSAVERIAPTSFIRTMIHDAESHPINVSGRHRHPTDRQKRVVRERDGGCVDCGSTELVEYDHVPDFEASKRTVVEELHVRCPTCHRARHRRDKL